MSHVSQILGSAEQALQFVASHVGMVELVAVVFVAFVAVAFGTVVLVGFLRLFLLGVLAQRIRLTASNNSIILIIP